MTCNKDGHDNEWWVRCWEEGVGDGQPVVGWVSLTPRHDEQRRVHISGVVLRRLNVHVISIALQRALLEEALCDVWRSPRGHSPGQCR